MGYKMDKNINKILVISDKNYQLIWIYHGLDSNYLYLINVDNYEDIIFAKLLDNDEIEMIQEQDKIGNIISLMMREINTFILL